MLCTICGEVERPTSSKGGRLLRRVSLRSRVGPIAEIDIFATKGCSGIDVQVPSTANPELLVWTNACTDEVQNCRQIAATNTVIPKENPKNVTSESTGQPAARDVTLKARETLCKNLSHFRKELRILFHAHEIFQIMSNQFFPKRQLG